MLILRISKFHASLHKEKKNEIIKARNYSLCAKVTLSVIHPTILPFTVFEEQCLAQSFVNYWEKLYLTVKSNDNWIFLIFFAFTIVFPLELATRFSYLFISCYYDRYFTCPDRL